MVASVLSVENLRTCFHTEDGTVKAVDGISFDVAQGHTLGIVGESGSGKSVTSLSIMQLLAGTARIESGTISFLGRNLVGLPESAMRPIRGAEIGMIFQEPMTSLNPVFTVGSQVMEAILLHQKGISRSAARKKTIALFEEVGIPDAKSRVDAYPHQLSGGQKQRVMIAMALSCDPTLLIADEPTTALDVTIQMQILEILRQLRDQRGMSIIFITHDLGVIAEIADHVAVMFHGRIVEYGDVYSVFQNPQHAYTKGLLACRPKLDSPYRRLPTVDDFLICESDGDAIRVIERAVDSERFDRLKTAGRGRLLHPAEELEAMGYPSDPSDYPEDTQLVGPYVEPLLRLEDLKVHFPVHRGFFRRLVDHVRAVDGIGFQVYPGQTLGLVGESGCGKTTAGRAILQLIRPTSGRVLFDGVDLCQLTSGEMYALRSSIQIIFQDPYGSLNPRMTVESAIVEPMRIQRIGTSRSDRRDRAVALLEEVGLLPEHLLRYPHEFSGGQRQRICIARCLAVEPAFIICDESVSALDVSVQAQVLNLLKDLQQRRGLTYVFISHDLSVVKFMSDMMAVMNEGKIVEFGPSDAIYANPKKAYTRKLIEAAPRDGLEDIKKRVAQRKAIREE